jgi:signal transduction histidine kinase
VRGLLSLDVGSQEDLAAVVAHDLAEPLRVIAHFARRLRANGDPEAGEAIEGIRAATERMGLLVGSLREYALAGTRGLARQTIDVDGVLDQAVANLKVALEETDARVRRDPLPRLHVDGIQLVRVFQNLIDNAVKFRGTGGCEIHVSAAREGRDWVLSVRDNGIGFDPQSAERIFELFERAHCDPERPGTGTGLAICARIVELHGGRIWASSTLGQGATFSFVLPDA